MFQFLYTRRFITKNSSYRYSPINPGMFIQSGCCMAM